MLLVQARAETAMEEESCQWRRPRRFASLLLSREIATMWDELGAAVQVLRGPRGPLIFGSDGGDAEEFEDEEPPSGSGAGAMQQRIA